MSNISEDRSPFLFTQDKVCKCKPQVSRDEKSEKSP